MCLYFSHVSAFVLQLVCYPIVFSCSVFVHFVTFIALP